MTVAVVMCAIGSNLPHRRDMIEDALQKPYRVFLFDTEEHYDELIAITTRAIQADPHNGIALNNRGVAKWEIGLLDEALCDLSKAVREMPQSAIPLVNCGDVLKKLSRFSEALTHYKAAIKIEPENPHIRRSCAHLLHEVERFDEAIAHYDVAIHLQPEFKRTYDDLKRAKARLPLVDS
jgi:tetratricopeptide (TPR) repeat protein